MGTEERRADRQGAAGDAGLTASPGIVYPARRSRGRRDASVGVSGLGFADVLQIAGQFGSTGLVVGYLIWRERGERQDRKETAAADIIAREKLASSLTALSMVIQGRPHV